MAKKKTFLVNIELPAKGMIKTCVDYRADLIARGYNRYQAIGSLGGSSRGGSIRITNSSATRI